jgi:hypothetical protein
VIKKGAKKISKYKAFNNRNTASVLPVKIWACGSTSTSFRKSEKHTGISQHQGTTENILGTAYILQNVLK